MKLRRAEMVMDGGAPRCQGCHQPLQFGTDRQGRTTESCACGYRGYLQTRPGQVGLRQDVLGEGHAPEVVAGIAPRHAG